MNIECITGDFPGRVKGENNFMKQVVIHANVFDGNHEKLKEDANIVIEDGIVKEIFQGDFDQTGFDQVFDAKHHTVIPGLANSHIHLIDTGSFPFMNTLTDDEYYIRSTRNAAEVLQRGFTSVRDAGGSVGGLKNSIDNGFVDGPRIFPAMGGLSQTCGHGDFRIYRSQVAQPVEYAPTVNRCASWVVADGVPAVQKAAREQMFRGASQIKLMGGGGMASFFDPLYTIQYSMEEMKAAVEVAQEYGTYAMAHLYTAAQVKRALEAGVMSVEHGTLMDEECAKMLADKGAWLCVCPQFGSSGGSTIPTKHIPSEHEILGTKPDKVKPTLQTMWDGLDHQAELIKKYNVNFLFGTDAPRAEHIDEEPADKHLCDFRNFKKRFGSFAGLKAATGNFYELQKLTTYQNPYPHGKVGVLEEGSYADLCVVEGNPVEDLEVLCDPENIRVVMKGGKIYRNTL